MERARHHLLAAAGLAGDDDGGARAAQPRQLRLQLAHGGRGGDEAGHLRRALGLAQGGLHLGEAAQHGHLHGEAGQARQRAEQRPSIRGQGAGHAHAQPAATPVAELHPLTGGHAGRSEQRRGAALRVQLLQARGAAGEEPLEHRHQLALDEGGPHAAHGEPLEGHPQRLGPQTGRRVRGRSLLHGGELPAEVRRRGDAVAAQLLLALLVPGLGARLARGARQRGERAAGEGGLGQVRREGEGGQRGLQLLARLAQVALPCEQPALVAVEQGGAPGGGELLQDGPGPAQGRARLRELARGRARAHLADGAVAPQVGPAPQLQDADVGGGEALRGPLCVAIRPVRERLHPAPVGAGEGLLDGAGVAREPVGQLADLRVAAGEVEEAGVLHHQVVRGPAQLLHHRVALLQHRLGLGEAAQAQQGVRLRARGEDEGEAPAQPPVEGRAGAAHLRERLLGLARLVQPVLREEGEAACLQQAITQARRGLRQLAEAPGGQRDLAPDGGLVRQPVRGDQPQRGVRHLGERVLQASVLAGEQLGRAQVEGRGHLRQAQLAAHFRVEHVVGPQQRLGARHVHVHLAGIEDAAIRRGVEVGGHRVHVHLDALGGQQARVGLGQVGQQHREGPPHVLVAPAVGIGQAHRGQGARARRAQLPRGE